MATMIKMSSVDESALHKLTKHGEVMLGEDGYFCVPGKYWSISRPQMRRLEAAGFAKIEGVGASTFATRVR